MKEREELPWEMGAEDFPGRKMECVVAHGAQIKLWHGFLKLSEGSTEIM